MDVACAKGARDVSEDIQEFVSQHLDEAWRDATSIACNDTFYSVRLITILTAHAHTMDAQQRRINLLFVAAALTAMIVVFARVSIQFTAQHSTAQ
jgi:hypothetical protein